MPFETVWNQHPKVGAAAGPARAHAWAPTGCSRVARLRRHLSFAAVRAGVWQGLPPLPRLL